MLKRVPGAAAGLAAIFSVSGLVSAGPSPQSTSFDVNLTINAECVLGTVTDMNFPAQGYLTSTTVDATATILYGCTKGTQPDVTLNDGLNNGVCPGGAPRCMKHATLNEYVNYDLYEDAGQTNPWASADTVVGSAGTGTLSGGAANTDQTITVYGNVPPQDTPTPGAYTDTVTATFTF